MLVVLVVLLLVEVKKYYLLGVEVSILELGLCELGWDEEVATEV